LVDMKHVSIRVSGVVQGVFFRASAKEKAEQLGIQGKVRNEHDGSVAIIAEGDDAAIEEFIEWCREGPRLSRVDRCVVKEEAVQNMKGFLIER
jgi:acylphosphatase